MAIIYFLLLLLFVNTDNTANNEIDVHNQTLEVNQVDNAANNEANNKTDEKDEIQKNNETDEKDEIQNIQSHDIDMKKNVDNSVSGSEHDVHRSDYDEIEKAIDINEDIDITKIKTSKKKIKLYLKKTSKKQFVFFKNRLLNQALIACGLIISGFFVSIAMVAMIKIYKKPDNDNQDLYFIKAFCNVFDEVINWIQGKELPKGNITETLDEKSPRSLNAMMLQNDLKILRVIYLTGVNTIVKNNNDEVKDDALVPDYEKYMKKDKDGKYTLDQIHWYRESQNIQINKSYYFILAWWYKHIKTKYGENFIKTNLMREKTLSQMTRRPTVDISEMNASEFIKKGNQSSYKDGKVQNFIENSEFYLFSEQELCGLDQMLAECQKTLSLSFKEAENAMKEKKEAENAMKEKKGKEEAEAKKTPEEKENEQLKLQEGQFLIKEQIDKGIADSGALQSFGLSANNLQQIIDFDIDAETVSEILEEVDKTESLEDALRQVQNAKTLKEILDAVEKGELLQDDLNKVNNMKALNKILSEAEDVKDLDKILSEVKKSVVLQGAFNQLSIVLKDINALEKAKISLTVFPQESFMELVNNIKLDNDITVTKAKENEVAETETTKTEDISKTIQDAVQDAVQDAIDYIGEKLLQMGPKDIILKETLAALNNLKTAVKEEQSIKNLKKINIFTEFNEVGNEVIEQAKKDAKKALENLETKESIYASKKTDEILEKLKETKESTNFQKTLSSIENEAIKDINAAQEKVNDLQKKIKELQKEELEEGIINKYELRIEEIKSEETTSQNELDTAKGKRIFQKLCNIQDAVAKLMDISKQEPQKELIRKIKVIRTVKSLKEFKENSQKPNNCNKKSAIEIVCDFYNSSKGIQSIMQSITTDPETFKRICRLLDNKCKVSFFENTLAENAEITKILNS